MTLVENGWLRSHRTAISLLIHSSQNYQSGISLIVSSMSGLGRSNTHIQLPRFPFQLFLFCFFVNQFQDSFLILCSCGCSWTSRALCIHHTSMAIFKHFNPLKDYFYERELYSHTEHTCRDEFAHLLPTKSK